MGDGIGRAAIPVPGPPAPADLPARRAVAVLDRAGTRETRRLLDRLAGGVEDAPVTREAGAALERLQ